jgi:8-oxo-dGTP pyrophosphatase MutT (NUDIX family)
MKPLKQVGALCICQADDGDELFILLVTSRDTRRWVIPKGWPAKSLKAHQAAAREAKEEAGVQGRASSRIFGKYRYSRPDKAGDQTHIVSVYLIAVRAMLDKWPEDSERKRAWFSLSSAARRVAEPELRILIRRLRQTTDHPKWRRKSELTRKAGRAPKKPRTAGAK